MSKITLNLKVLNKPVLCTGFTSLVGAFARAHGNTGCLSSALPDQKGVQVHIHTPESEEETVRQLQEYFGNRRFKIKGAPYDDSDNQRALDFTV